MTAGRNQNPLKVALLFDREAIFPPSIDDMKAFYVSRQLIRRGANVCWLQFNNEPQKEPRDGISFVNLRSATNVRILRPLFMILGIVSFCLSSGVNVVYIDEWLMFRSELAWQLALRVVLRLVGLIVVFDLRDPYIDYQIAYGKLRYGSLRHAFYRIQYSLIYKLTDLIILPSQVYANAYVSEERIPTKKIIGIPRGVDSEQFNTDVDPTDVKKDLGLQGKFVVGWFGMMHKYRLVKEIIVPTIKSIRDVIPDGHVLIGGKGELLRSFEELEAAKPEYPFTLLGLVPYNDLPNYIAACDVLLSPIDPSYRFTQNSVWLKILEALAVGRPIISTRTGLKEGDFKDVKGIVWTEPNLASFLDALKHVRDNYAYYLQLASEQASHFQDFTTDFTISRLVDKIEQLALQ